LTWSIRQPFIPVVLFRPFILQGAAAPTLKPEIRNEPLVVVRTSKLRPFTVVTPIPCPRTVIFLFCHETAPAVQVPAAILTVSPSADALMAACNADVMFPDAATFLVVPPVVVTSMDAPPVVTRPEALLTVTATGRVGITPQT
jgi:hypothetical protein